MALIKWTVAGLLISLACGGLYAAPADDTLPGKLHPGKKEADVAKEWFEKKLPAYIKGLVETNQFPKTYIEFPGKDKGVKPCEIRDITKNGFRAYQLVADNQDDSGKTVYRVSKDGVEFTFKHWPPQHMIDIYPVRTSTDDVDVSAVAIWLYSISQPRLANRVLTIIHQRNKDLRPLIEGYIIEKEKLKAKPGQLEIFNEWDSEFQLERVVLVTADDKLKLITERESAAKKKLDEIRLNRGDYDKDPAKRRRQPRKLLLMVQWDIKEFKRTYQATDLCKDAKTVTLLDEMSKSIDADFQIIRNNYEKAQAFTSSQESDDWKKRAQILELLLKIDPEDIRLLQNVAGSWFDYARESSDSNSCMNEEGAKRAIEFYEKILEKCPQNTSFMINMGKCYQVQGNGKARDIYNKVIELDGKDRGNGAIATRLIEYMNSKDRFRQTDKPKAPK
ncbi:MAG: hypothetical protein IT462_01800 [Planctomycetes bacterium]|nr:hypothetical protein [Planctomycetota bacterium]